MTASGRSIGKSLLELYLVKLGIDKSFQGGQVIDVSAREMDSDKLRKYDGSQASS